ncbi:uncharacterized protein LOC132268946 [Cornus florida]|uniref:uncharacterized protein LOC132268946 n=1 Tax=Cornus florida TaxID=4283 RepID=UPI00289F39B6|nr:uncharacterized protein LOC132268946 [Cornus florida]
MGRKPKAAKVVEGIADTMPENANPSLEMVNPGTKMQPNSAFLDLSKKDAACLPTKKKASKNQKAIVRRSERLHNIIPHARNQEIEPVIEEINLVESEKEDEPNVEQNSSEPLPHERDLEEKIDYLVETMEELKSKAAKRYFQSEIKQGDLSYRGLYIESQKKIEALTDENNQLSKNLEIAIAKLEGFEKGSRNCSKIIDKLKDVFLISNLAKATEAAFNLPTQETSGGNSSLDGAAEPQVSAMKRKRVAARSKKN